MSQNIEGLQMKLSHRAVMSSKSLNLISRIIVNKLITINGKLINGIYISIIYQYIYMRIRIA